MGFILIVYPLLQLSITKANSLINLSEKARSLGALEYVRRRELHKVRIVDWPGYVVK